MSRPHVPMNKNDRNVSYIFFSVDSSQLKLNDTLEKRKCINRSIQVDNKNEYEPTAAITNENVMK